MFGRILGIVIAADQTTSRAEEPRHAQYQGTQLVAVTGVVEQKGAKGDVEMLTDIHGRNIG
jgi:hypothetical protein